MVWYPNPASAVKRPFFSVPPASVSDPVVVSARNSPPAASIVPLVLSATVFAANGMARNWLAVYAAAALMVELVTVNDPGPVGTVDITYAPWSTETVPLLTNVPESVSADPFETVTVPLFTMLPDPNDVR